MVRITSYRIGQSIFSIQELHNICKALTFRIVKIKKCSDDIVFCVFYQTMQWLIFLLPIIINSFIEQSFDYWLLFEMVGFVMIFSTVPLLLCGFIAFMAEKRYTAYLYRLFCYSSIYNISMFVIMYFLKYYYISISLYVNYILAFVVALVVIVTFSRNILYTLKSRKNSITKFVVPMNILLLGCQHALLFVMLP
ncbi:hypothetical protein SLOPH_2333 [Spraguea lophii 42_110]|uniref:Uncharacterized protein n=1 Tax=Spraguea lophii (strain 42_110) TaxID=1358809 RepID=S7WDI3_SPRLO|nr:hypothetical protein SLOPH_2333 [Spraguea lophii 42_110]